MNTDWIYNLFMGTGVAHSVLLVALVIAAGLFLSRIKIAGISLGVTWILFAGIACGHFGMVLDPTTSHFVKEFGLILFIYSIGLQVGPGFFSSFRKGGVTYNMLATAIVLLGGVTAYAIHLITGESLFAMIGAWIKVTALIPLVGILIYCFLTSDLLGTAKRVVSTFTKKGIAAGKWYLISLVLLIILAVEAHKYRRDYTYIPLDGEPACERVDFAHCGESPFEFCALGWATVVERGLARRLRWTALKQGADMAFVMDCLLNQSSSTYSTG